MLNYRIALIGFGGVNRALAQLIADRNLSWQRELGFGLTIVAVTDLHYGSIIVPAGVDAKTLANTKAEKGCFAALFGGSADANNESIIKQTNADFIVEATYTNPKDGEPAVSHCRWALAAGKHVVTTNKGPVALAACELKRIAVENGVCFEFEGAVMSGTPVIRMAQKTLAGVGLNGFEGILNGTSNFVLGRMEQGLEFADAVKEAQSLGYAEADPTADVEGHDVRLKVVILANELLGASLVPSSVSCTGIAGLTQSDIQLALKENCRWKLIGTAIRKADGEIEASVAPQRLSISHPLASVGGAMNAVAFKTDLLGTVTVAGPGAGRFETAYALLSDIIAIHYKTQTMSLKAAR